MVLYTSIRSFYAIINLGSWKRIWDKTGNIILMETGHPYYGSWNHILPWHIDLTFGYISVGALRKSRAHFSKKSALLGARFCLAKCIPASVSLIMMVIYKTYILSTNGSPCRSHRLYPTFWLMLTGWQSNVKERVCRLRHNSFLRRRLLWLSDRLLSHFIIFLSFPSPLLGKPSNIIMFSSLYRLAKPCQAMSPPLMK